MLGVKDNQRDGSDGDISKNMNVFIPVDAIYFFSVHVQNIKYVSRVMDQNGISRLYNMLEIICYNHYGYFSKRQQQKQQQQKQKSSSSSGTMKGTTL